MKHLAVVAVIVLLVTFLTVYLLSKKSKKNTVQGYVPQKETHRMVTYIEGWGNTVYGQPKNYTHAMYAFAVPYHYWGGTCSGWCTPWASQDQITGAQTIVARLKQENPNIKVFLSLGGWNFDHFAWKGPKHSQLQNGCQYICKPTDKTMDDPAQYSVYSSQSLAKYNCKLTGETGIQPSEYCYGSQGKSDPSSAEHVGTTLANLCQKLGADGVDIDIEDTCSMASENSFSTGMVFDFMTRVIKQVKKSNPSLGISLAPLNPYMVVDIDTGGKQCNGKMIKFNTVAQNYRKFVMSVMDDLDFVSIQFYNNIPEAYTDPSGVIKSYNEIVKNVFGGDASKVVLGMCSFAEPGTCQNCGPNCYNATDRCNNLVKKLATSYPDFGGVMQWAANGDVQRNAQGKTFSDVMVACMKA